MREYSPGEITSKMYTKYVEKEKKMNTSIGHTLFNFLSKLISKGREDGGCLEAPPGLFITLPASSVHTGAATVGH